MASPEAQPAMPSTPAALAKVVPLKRGRDDAAFLPAAVELLETPPPVLGRAILWAVVGFLCLALAWAWIGRLDVVVVAPGKLIPAGRVKVVQPLEAGRVAALHVAEGDRVEAGQILVELDPTEAAADVARLSREQTEARVEAARLQSFVAALDGAVPDFRAPGATSELVALHAALLTSQLAEHRAKLLALDGEAAQRRAEVQASRAEIVKLEQVLPLVERRAGAQAQLAKAGAAPELKAAELEQERVTAAQGLAVQKARQAQAEAALATIAATRAKLEAEARRAALEGLADARRRADALEQERAKARERELGRVLRAPVSGTVQQLQVTAPGQVVTPAQPLLVVVPADAALEVEASVPNKDVGFVHAGQEAIVKVETFPFTKYGHITGTVRLVARDAVTPEAAAGESPAPLYLARVALARTTMTVDGRTVELTPGMAVAVEVKTGTRRVIEFLLDPLVRAGKEALRER